MFFKSTHAPPHSKPDFAEPSRSEQSELKALLIYMGHYRSHAEELPPTSRLEKDQVEPPMGFIPTYTRIAPQRLSAEVVLIWQSTSGLV